MSSQIKSNTVLNLNTLLVSDMQIYTHIRKHVDWTSIVAYNITQVISYRSDDFEEITIKSMYARVVSWYGISLPFV